MLAVLKQLRTHATFRGVLKLYSEAWTPTSSSFVILKSLCPKSLAAFSVMSPKEPATSDVDSQNASDTGFMKNKLGLKIFCKYWSTESHPKALVFICHGLTEHTGCYEKLAVPLTKNGYLVFAHDHIGHGRSEGPRAFVDKVDDYVADVCQHVDMMKKKYPNIPVFLVGHSMGGLIAITLAEERVGYFDGMVLIGPAVLPNPDLAKPVILTISRLLGRYLPKLPVRKIDIYDVCFNKAAVDELITDPLRITGFLRAGFCLALIEGVEKAYGLLNKVQDPFLVLQGEHDKICHVQGARDLFDHSTSKDKKIKIYPDANHMLLYEWKNIDQEVIRETVDWLNSHVQ